MAPSEGWKEGSGDREEAGDRGLVEKDREIREWLCSSPAEDFGKGKRHFIYLLLIAYFCMLPSLVSERSGYPLKISVFYRT